MIIVLEDELAVIQRQRTAATIEPEGTLAVIRRQQFGVNTAQLQATGLRQGDVLFRPDGETEWAPKLKRRMRC